MPPKRKSTKGSASKTRPGDMDYTTKKGDKDFHQDGRDVTKTRKPYTRKPTKKGTAILGGKKITFNKGGLHRSLKVPMAYTFTRPTMARLNKHADGKTFTFQGNKIKMTPKIHKQLVLGMNLMKRK
tara:strand:- start:122 stop:499 length:378 start_codon:yes stop_codon:yes gene_type:complete